MERRERKNAVTVLAPAKLNLALDVVGLLPNGYHALDMTMQTITLYERVVLRRSQNLSLTLPGSPVAANDSNTAIKAAGADIVACRARCSCSAILRTARPSWACPAASCTRARRSSI